MRVLLAAQVVAFVRRQPPEPRSRLRRALRNLANEQGDIKALEPPFEGYCRLRVGGYRIVFAYGKRRTIECIFAERRSVVYELLLERLRDRLRGGEE
jgi:mRNA-degrading endonuclease RelE of RelBE toxin-antitoxin system